MRPLALAIAAALVISGHAGNSAVPTLRLTAAQERGKTIYVRGESIGGRPITAVLGDEETGVPAAIVPCANCHGEDGRGKPEGSVLPPDITPESLARVTQVNGRTRPRYTRPLLKRAITMGFDSGRNELNAAMPRYRMVMQDAEDLLLYLEIVGHEPQPGVSSDAIRIKLVGETGELRGAEVYGRRLELVREGEAFFTIDTSDDPGASVAAAERDHIPTIVVHAPVSTNPYTFVLTAGADEQRAALRAFARGQESVMIDDDCMAGLARSAALPHPPLVLMTAAVAKTCDLATIPAALDRRIVVAAPLPPRPTRRGAPPRRPWPSPRTSWPNSGVMSRGRPSSTPSNTSIGSIRAFWRPSRGKPTATARAPRG